MALVDLQVTLALAEIGQVQLVKSQAVTGAMPHPKVNKT